MDLAEQYLQSYKNYFWQYEDEGNIIAIPGGYTIGYTNLIFKEIIPTLAIQGLPQFGSLLLAITATNSQGEKALQSIESIMKSYDFQNHSEVKEGIDFVKLLTTIPSEYTKSNARLELLRALFLNSHRSVSVKKSMRIAKQLKTNSDLIVNSTARNKVEITNVQFIKDLKILAIIGRKLKSADDIIERIAGLPTIELELEDNEPYPIQHEDGLAGDLMQTEAYHVGALLTRIMSGLQIPFHSTMPSEQPLGGVADITNKGSFDKLLMSEFAFDDQILLSRLANNESLYHHREVPPSDNNYSRIILLDNTLNNWGTIKTISHASMLAITSHPKNKNPCNVFLIGQEYKEIQFETINDIIGGLQILDSSLDPGVGLLKLFTEEQIARSEIFYIGTSENLDTEGMRKFNSEFGKRIDYWIHPTNEGEISVYKNPKRGKRFIQNINLPLDKLWSKSTFSKKEITTYTDYEHPILFPSYKFKSIWLGKNYTYAITKNNALVRLYQNDDIRKKGWEIVSKKVQPNDLLRAVMTHNDLSITVLALKRKNEYDLIHLPANERISITIARGLDKFELSGEYFNCSSHTSTYQVDKLGTVSNMKHQFRVKENFRVDKTKELNTNISHIYRNVDNVYITTNNQLRFGKQDLELNNSRLKLIHTGSALKNKLDASRMGKGKFIFPDGSTISHNRDGMFILVSSSKSLPTIYLPAVLQVPLGVATTKHFAGNPYFQMEAKYEIALLREITNKLEVTKSIKSSFGDITLNYAKSMVDSGILWSTEQQKIKALQTELNELQIPYVTRRRGIGQTQEVITTNEFYRLYIKEFINQIIKHGAESTK